MPLTVEEFIAERPCPCECEGYADGLRVQLELPEHFPVPAYPKVDGAVLEPLIRWRAAVMEGKSTPSPESCLRCHCFVYRRGRKPATRKLPVPARKQPGSAPPRFAAPPERASTDGREAKTASSLRFGPKPPAPGGSRFGGKGP